MSTGQPRIDRITPSRHNGLTSVQLDRLAEKRNDQEWLQGALKSAAARFVPLWRNRCLLENGATGSRAVYLESAETAALGAVRPTLLGSDGERLLFEDLTFDAPPGAIVGVIGANGAGKTTMFRMIVKQEEPDSGNLRVGDSVELAYVDQSRDTLDGEKTVWQEISDGEETLMLGERRVNSRAYVSRFNFTGSDQQKKVGTLSGGERNRVHLAKMLKSGANLILLDEPTNDLDVNTLRALEEALDNFGGSAIVISHDRWYLDRVATHILAFEGDSQAFWFPGNYSEYEEDRRRRLGAEAERPHRITYRRLRRD